jgi:hypothetical protein
MSAQANISNFSSSSELAIMQFVKDIKLNSWSEEVLLDKFAKVLQLHIAELEECSDIVFNPKLARTLVSTVDFNELRTTEAFEYVVRKYVRSIMKLYVQNVSKARPIHVKDKTLFDLQMESYGINVGFTAETASRSLTPDGNVIVVMIGILLIAALVVFRPKITK